MDINCDMGESYYTKKIGDDSKIMPYITSCNIACGFHGGDPLTINNTIDLAIKHGVRIGAHPSYFDLEGFGRRKVHLTDKELEVTLIYQISAIYGMVKAKGETLHHVKAHGALYNMASTNDKIAKIIIESVKKVDPNLKIYGPSMLNWKTITENSGLKYVSEVFSDRNYNDDLTLVNRKLKNSMITDCDKSIQHILNMVLQNKVVTINNKMKTIAAETICIHGDQENAANFAKNIHSVLKSKGIKL